jgi:hypothetical protein
MARNRTPGLPAPPNDWDSSSRDVWVRLTQILENSDLFPRGRRTLPQFVVKGTVSVSVTFDAAGAGGVAAATQVLGKLLLSLQDSNFVDVRQTT